GVGRRRLFWLGRQVPIVSPEAGKRIIAGKCCLEANGYRQLATQQQQMTQCREWGADGYSGLADKYRSFPRRLGNELLPVSVAW
ncbi:hypothetical protein VS877_22395, partial [Salmonella enterica subsp. enterica serovar Paratyphi A]|nr:hypothetical protein [Salmonella enterica subsp. enterica serovar Paratyphi A]